MGAQNSRNHVLGNYARDAVSAIQASFRRRRNTGAGVSTQHRDTAATHGAVKKTANSYEDADDSSDKIYMKIDFRKKVRRFVPSFPDHADLVEMLEREVLDRYPNVTWQDVADLGPAKKHLEDSVIVPMLNLDNAKDIPRIKGIVMVGPPGTGKSTLAMALATECGATFFNVSSSTLTSKYQNESRMLVRLIFEMAYFYSPSVIMINEIDVLCSQRCSDGKNEALRRFKSELLLQMDTLNSTVFNDHRKIVVVIAATNQPWDVDEALRRRLEERIYIPLPTQEGREALLYLNLRRSVDHRLDIRSLSKLFDGYTGDEIVNACRNTVMAKLSNSPANEQDFRETISKCNKTVSKDDIQAYVYWMAEFGSP